MTGLSQPLTVLRGTALMLNIVVGAGLLALPGLAVKQVGDHAMLAWLVAGAATLPLLAVFILLGRRYPNAGGIAHFAGIAFGRRGYAAASLIFLGAVLFGLPSIAITGGHYAAVIKGWPPHAIAIALLIAATLIHMVSSELVAKANTVLAIVILIAITALILAGFLMIEQPSDMPVAVWPEELKPALALAPFTMIFFAFTGWEVAAGSAEEFRNPRRDFPIAMIASFAIILGLYLGIAYLTQVVSLEGEYETAFSRIAAAALGSFGEIGTALLATVIILANLSGAIWAVSRMVFALSREGFLPSALEVSRNGTPWRAVAVTSTALVIVTLADAAGIFGLDRMLALAGQNFLVLYGIAAGAMLALSTSTGARILALLASALTLGLVAIQGAAAVYPAALLGLGIALGGLRTNASSLLPEDTHC